MFVVLISFILSIELKKRKSSRYNLFNKNSTSLKKGSKSTIDFLEVDSVLCYDYYTSSLTTFKAIDPDNPSDPNIAALNNILDTFKLNCLQTLAKDGCSAAVDDLIGDPKQTKATEFETKCEISEPTADTKDCYSAYDALVKAIEKLKPAESGKIKIKASPADEFNDFVAKCPKTSHAVACKTILADISTATGPVYNNLQDIKEKCLVSAPTEDPTEEPAESKGDAGIASLFLANKKVLLIFTLVQFYFMI
jgi:hypothetical protein